MIPLCQVEIIRKSDSLHNMGLGDIDTGDSEVLYFNPQSISSLRSVYDENGNLKENRCKLRIIGEPPVECLVSVEQFLKSIGYNDKQ